MAPVWFDAHLDLACLAVNGRDMHAPAESCGGPWQPAGVTLNSLAGGGVRLALGTIFTERGGGGPEGYDADDIEMAHRRGRAQLEVYLTWKEQGAAAIDIPRLFSSDPGVGAIRGGMGVSETRPIPLEKRIEKHLDAAPIHLGVLMENADPIRSPDELAWWVKRGVCAIGMSWWASSRYAGGNGASGVGLSDMGRDLVAAMDELGVVHDLSHLSQQATDELFAATERPVMASHSNCRALLDPDNERHISDESIREVGRRGGVVGVNLVSAFLDDQIFRNERGGGGDGARATIEDVVAHIEHICEITGDQTHVGLGSDMDGGIPRTKLPEGVEGPRDLEKIAEALAGRGWSPEEIDGFRWKNWARFFERIAADRRSGGRVQPAPGG